MIRLRKTPQVLRNNVTLNHDQAELEFKLQRPKRIARRENEETQDFMVQQWQAEADQARLERDR